MKKTALSGVMALLCLCITAQQALIKPLSIGDVVPDITFHNLLHYNKPTAKLSDFKGRLVILDFWSTWCKACIYSFPELQKLQNANGDKIQIVLVTNNSTQQVQKLFSSLRAKGKEVPGLPIITTDTFLSSLFPHTMVPHHVWINDNRMVMAITESEQASQQNLNNFFATGAISLPLKNDLIADENITGNQKEGIGKGTAQRGSVFSKMIKGKPSLATLAVDSFKQTRTIKLSNITLRQMYEFAFQKTFADNRVIVNSPKSSFKDSMYSYELVQPLTDTANVYDLLLLDLKNNLPLKARVTMMLLPCWELRDHAQSLPIFTGKRSSEYDLKTKLYNQKNGTIQNLINVLDYYAPKPVFDATRNSPRSAIVGKFDFSNETTLKHSLARYGFTLADIRKNVEVLVLE